MRKPWSVWQLKIASVQLRSESTGSPKSYAHKQLQDLPRWKRTLKNTGKHTKRNWRQEFGVGDKCLVAGLHLSSPETWHRNAHLSEATGVLHRRLRPRQDPPQVITPSEGLPRVTSTHEEQPHACAPNPQQLHPTRPRRPLHDSRDLRSPMSRRAPIGILLGRHRPRPEGSSVSEHIVNCSPKAT